MCVHKGVELIYVRMPKKTVLP